MLSSLNLIPQIDRAAAGFDGEDVAHAVGSAVRAGDEDLVHRNTDPLIWLSGAQLISVIKDHPSRRVRPVGLAVDKATGLLDDDFKLGYFSGRARLGSLSNVNHFSDPAITRLPAGSVADLDEIRLRSASAGEFLDQIERMPSDQAIGAHLHTKYQHSICAFLLGLSSAAGDARGFATMGYYAAMSGFLVALAEPLILDDLRRDGLA